MPIKKKFLTGDSTSSAADAYEQAITEGLINPQKVSLSQFLKKFVGEHIRVVGKREWNQKDMLKTIEEERRATKSFLIHREK